MLIRTWILNLTLLLVFVSVAAQEKTCSDFKNGKFQLRDERAGNSTLEREGARQVEYSERSKVKLAFKVEWLDPCTYTLELVEVLENPNRIQLPEGMILTVEILQTKEKSYIQRSSSNLYSMVFESEIFRLD